MGIFRWGIQARGASKCIFKKLMDALACASSLYAELVGDRCSWARQSSGSRGGPLKNSKRFVPHPPTPSP